MKQLIRRLSLVAHSSSSSYQYSLLRSHSRTPSRSRRHHRHHHSHSVGRSPERRVGGGAKAVPEGHVPVYVGEEMERFVVSAEVLNHPLFVELLEKSAQEYGYDQKGALRIPCHVVVFERIMEALRLGVGRRGLDDLLSSSLFAEDCF